jgi:hypothetical protein
MGRDIDRRRSAPAGGFVRTNILAADHRLGPAADASINDTLASFRSASLIVGIVSVLLALVLGVASHIRVDPDGIAPNAWLAAALLTVSLIMRGAEHRRIADLTGALGLAWVGALNGGALALLGLRMHLPMVDPLLRRADLVLGFDGINLVAALVRQGQWLFSIMAPAYEYTIPLLAFSMCFLAATGRGVEAWRASLCFTGTLLTVSVVAIFTPAKGLGLWAPPELLAHLPDDAMVYFWPNLDAFYTGADPVLSTKAVSGVISFPSFHAAMGFITVAMWRSNLLTLAAASAWFFFMLLSTFAYGGHYLVDVIAGLAIAAGWFAASRYFEIKCRPIDAPARQPSCSLPRPTP